MYCAGRVAIVTGAANGIGKEHALELARQGARVVVNDRGGDVHGAGADRRPVDEVVDEIKAMGGEAVASLEDVGDWEGARRIVATAIEAFGELHVLVNNAGILRDRMIVNMTEDEWDGVIRVHLRGTFATTRHAAQYWRGVHKSGGSPNARVINTSSASGLYGNIGQGNYGAAKAGIAAFTMIAAEEFARFGVTVNAIAPAARTRMTDSLPRYQLTEELRRGEVFDVNDPANVAPLVAWLASEASAGVTGEVFDIRGGDIDVARRWTPGPGVSKDRRWRVEELDGVIPQLIEQRGQHGIAVLTSRAQTVPGPQTAGGHG
jgi:NAD(P)-dependent dehydrogenase (short-subunit alcohol dehydrogenase family)